MAAQAHMTTIRPAEVRQNPAPRRNIGPRLQDKQSTHPVSGDHETSTRRVRDEHETRMRAMCTYLGHSFTFSLTTFSHSDSHADSSESSSRGHDENETTVRRPENQEQGGMGRSRDDHGTAMRLVCDQYEASVHVQTIIHLFIQRPTTQS